MTTMATTNQNIINLANERFGAYAKYIILNRALPDVRDGLKPVQRRILYAMGQLNLYHNQAYKKSARVVGDVIGKYHPHGDSSIYEALVRMAQDWKMHLPLVDMHGNKGSIDDDPAAAMRYTEVKLSPVSTLMLEHLKQNTVSFQPNFDDSEREPTVLPTLLCNLLINGANGIAAGFATQIAPHNLNEVYDALIHLVKQPDCRDQTIAKIIKGPDFPTGANVLVSEQEWIKIVKTGSGKITIQAQATISKNQIVISAIPYQVVKSKLVSKIEELMVQNEMGIKAINDHSDRHGIKIVIDLDQNANGQAIWNYILSKTEAQINYHYNIVAITNQSPQQLGITQALKHYLNFIKVVKTSAIEFEYNRAKTRLEIVKGLIQAHLISDQIIKCIRQTSGGKQAVIANLVKQFKFSQIQAQAISELMLYRLGKTDLSTYENEAKDLEQQINYYQNLLHHQAAFNKYLIEQFIQIKKTYGINRRSQIINKIVADVATNAPISVQSLVAPSKIVVGLSKYGMIKRISPSAWKGDLSTYGLESNDQIHTITNATTNDHLIIFFASGHYGIIDLYKLPINLQKANGINIETYIRDYAKQPVIGTLVVKDHNYEQLNDLRIGLFSQNGSGKLIYATQLAHQKHQRLLRVFPIRDPDNQLIKAIPVANINHSLLLLTKNQVCLRIEIKSVPQQSLAATGAILIKLKPDDQLISAYCNSAKKPIHFVDQNQHLVAISSLGQIPKANRATRGTSQFLKSLNHQKPLIDIQD